MVFHRCLYQHRHDDEILSSLRFYFMNVWVPSEHEKLTENNSSNNYNEETTQSVKQMNEQFAWRSCHHVISSSYASGEKDRTTGKNVTLSTMPMPIIFEGKR